MDKNNSPQNQFNSRRDSANNNPVNGVPSSYMAHPNSVFTKQAISGDVVEHRSAHKKLIAFLALFIVLIIAGAAGYMWLKMRDTTNPQETFNEAVSNSLATTTVKTSVPIASEGSNLSYVIDQSDAKNVKVSFDNFQTSKGQLSMRIIGQNVFAKQLFSDSFLASYSGDQLVALQKINGVWVQWMKDGKEVAMQVPDAVKIPLLYAKKFNFAPAMIPVVNVSDDARQELNTYRNSQSVYTVGSEKPIEDTIDGAAAWRFTVAVNKTQLKEYNKRVLTALGSAPTESALTSFAQSSADTMQVWVRQSDTTIVKYASAVNGKSVETPFADINATVTITAPDMSPDTNKKDTPITDTTVKNVMNELGIKLEASGFRNDTYPSNATEFDAYVKSNISVDIRSRFTFSYTNQLPTAMNQVSFQRNARCDVSDTNFYSEAASDREYAIVVKLTNGTLCSDNVD